ncbi:MAG: hypothetical protein J0L64_24475 [Acidobacteria bacterium]|nr:hypothetical protein [Acidobacteriota bacterium]
MFRSVLTATLLAALASLSLPAQSVKLQATIPFDFHIGQALMPAGDYSVLQRPGFLIVRGDYAHPKSAAAVVMQASAVPAASSSKLVFNRYGDDYFLASVWQEGASAGLMLPKAKREQVRSRLLTDTASSLRAPQTTIIHALRVK